MELKDLSTTRIKDSPVVKQEGRFPPMFNGLSEEIPFKKGDKVVVNDKHTVGKEDIMDIDLIVKECFLSDLGDMSVHIVRFEQKGNIKNPYLAHHFDKI